MTEVNVDGMALAPGVIETIISMATTEVEGVASVGSMTNSSLRSMFGAKPAIQGIEVDVSEDDKLCISVRIEVFAGKPLPDIAAAVRRAVADAVNSQVGIPAKNVDVYIDGIRFEN